VVAYYGVLADKAAGEVEGVWEAIALFGGTGSQLTNLRARRFDKTGESKGSKAGFMTELAIAVRKTQAEALGLWEQAKDEFQVLEEHQEKTLLKS